MNKGGRKRKSDETRNREKEENVGTLHLAES
jgi:hypothetical protein